MFWSKASESQSRGKADEREEARKIERHWAGGRRPDPLTPLYKEELQLLNWHLLYASSLPHFIPSHPIHYGLMRHKRLSFSFDNHGTAYTWGAVQG